MEYDISLCNSTEFFLTATTPLTSHKLTLISKTIVLAMPMSALLQHAALMQNMNKSTSMMLLSTNITSCFINTEIYSIYYLNTKSYLMALLEFILTKRFTLTSNLELSWYNILLTLYLTSTVYIIPKKNGWI